MRRTCFASSVNHRRWCQARQSACALEQAVHFPERYTHGPSISKGEVRVSAVQPYLLDGSHVMTVEVKRADKAAVRTQPFTVSASQSGMDNLNVTDQARKAMQGIGFRSDTTNSTSTSSSGSGSSLTFNSNSTSSSSASNASEKSTSTSTTASSSNAFWTSTKEYPHTRSAQVWKQDNWEAFKNGKTDGVMLDSWGRLVTGYHDAATQQLSDDMRIWSAVWSNGNFWFSTGNKVYKWNGKGAPNVVAQLDAVAIPALVADSKGNLYAAAAPSATIYKIQESNSKVEQLAKAAEPLITSMIIDDKDWLYFGVSGAGKVYKIDLFGSDQKPSLLFDSGQAIVTSLFYSTPEKAVLRNG